MSVAADVRKGYQDFVVPEMSGLKEGLNGVKEAVQSLRLELSDTDKRLLAAIESAKKEILLTVKVSVMAEKIAEQARIIEEQKKDRPQ